MAQKSIIVSDGSGRVGPLSNYEGLAVGDGYSQRSDIELPKVAANAIAIKNASISPELLSFTMGMEGGKKFTGVFVYNLAEGKMRYARGFLDEGGVLNEVMEIDELGIKGMPEKQDFIEQKLLSALIDLPSVSAIERDEKMLALLHKDPVLKSNFLQMFFSRYEYTQPTENGAEKELTQKRIRLQDAEDVLQKASAFYQALPALERSEYADKIKKTGLSGADKIAEAVERGRLAEIKMERFLRIELDDLLCMSDAYVSMKEQGKTAMAEAGWMIREANPSISYAKTEYLNYTISGNLPHGGLLLVKSGAISTPEGANGYSIKKALEEGKYAEKVKEHLATNVDKLKSMLAAPNGKHRPQHFFYNLGLARTLELATWQLGPNLKGMEDLSYEEKIKAIEAAKSELANNAAKRKEMGSFVETSFKNAITVLHASPYIRARDKAAIDKHAQSIVKMVSGGEVGSAQYIKALEELQRIQQSIVMALKGFQNNVFPALYAPSMIAPSNTGHFPKQNGRGSKIASEIFSDASLRYNMDVIFGFNGMILGKEGKGWRFGTNLVPVLGKLSNGEYFKASPALSGATKLLYQLQNLHKKNEDEIEDEEKAKKQLDSTKKFLLGAIESVRSQPRGAQALDLSEQGEVGAKSDSIDAVIQEIKVAKTKQDIIVAVEKVPLFASAKNAQDVGFTVEVGGKRFDAANIKKIAENSPISKLKVDPSNPFPAGEIVASYTAHNGFRNFPSAAIYELDDSVFPDNEKKYNGQDAYRLDQLSRGAVSGPKRLHYRHGKGTHDREKLNRAFSGAAINVVFPEDDIQAGVREEIYEAFPAKANKTNALQAARSLIEELLGEMDPSGAKVKETPDAPEEKEAPDAVYENNSAIEEEQGGDEVAAFKKAALSALAEKQESPAEASLEAPKTESISKASSRSMDDDIRRALEEVEPEVDDTVISDDAGAGFFDEEESYFTEDPFGENPFGKEEPLFDDEEEEDPFQQPRTQKTLI